MYFGPSFENVAGVEECLNRAEITFIESLRREIYVCSHLNFLMGLASLDGRMCACDRHTYDLRFSFFFSFLSFFFEESRRSTKWLIRL